MFCVCHTISAGEMQNMGQIMNIFPEKQQNLHCGGTDSKNESQGHKAFVLILICDIWCLLRAQEAVKRPLEIVRVAL